MYKRRVFICFLCALSIFLNLSIFNSMFYVYGKTDNDMSNSIKYQYDSLGRIIYATYPDGSKISYSYDSAGNVSKSEIKAVMNNKIDDKSGSENIGINKKSDNVIDASSSTSDNNISEVVKKGERSDSGVDDIDHEKKSDDQEYISQTMVNYKLFKSKRPVVKIIKKIKNKKQLYIKIKQAVKRGVYGEVGYQIRYANNSKFKKSRTVFVKRSKKGTYTTKKWRVKKNRIYYVKVRGYIKNKNGKKIYGKYSKVKKVKFAEKK